MSLGWLTESAIMPRKRREIEGVSASSLVELRASVYEREEQLRQGVQPLKKPKLAVDGIGQRTTKGLVQRAKKEAEEDQAELQQARQRLQHKSSAYAAFHKQGTLFDKEGDNCLVDFERKRWEEEEEEEERGARARPPAWFEEEDDDLAQRELLSEDMQRELLRRHWEREQEEEEQQDEARAVKKAQRQEAEEGLEEEAKEAQQRLRTIQQRKQDALRKRREQIMKLQGQGQNQQDDE